MMKYLKVSFKIIKSKCMGKHTLCIVVSLLEIHLTLYYDKNTFLLLNFHINESLCIMNHSAGNELVDLEIRLFKRELV